MKFGEYLQSQKVQAWDASYLDYNRLKTMIKELETQHLSHYSQDLGKGKKRICNCVIVIGDGDVIHSNVTNTILIHRDVTECAKAN